MKIRYIYSACVEIHHEGTVVLTDPWFTEGAYDGSWYQFPKIDDPLDVIQEPDAIYVSHIHPDHYDPKFLHQLFDKYGEKPILIADFQAPYLVRKMAADGFKPVIVGPGGHQVGTVEVHIVPNETGSSSDIDSALIAHADGATFLNLNDCAWNDAHVDQIHDLLQKNEWTVDMVALGYTGAGPFPQVYFDPEHERDMLLRKVEEKKEAFFARYRRYCERFDARFHMPFAGKYILGGHLAPLNKWRGVADAVEVLAFDDRAVVLADAGEGQIDLVSGEVVGRRTEPYPDAAMEQRIQEIQGALMDYERDITTPYDKIPFARLLRAAYQRALDRSEVERPHWFVLELLEDGKPRDRFSLNCVEYEFLVNEEAPGEPYSKIHVDYRYLFGLMTGMYHWNNADVGSQFRCTRVPIDAFDEAAQAFLNFLCCV